MQSTEVSTRAAAAEEGMSSPTAPPWLQAGAQEVMRTLYDVARRANAAWQRMGQDEVSREARLQHFFSHSLTLFLTDFCTLAEAEERDCVLENDAHLRELYFLASYLRQPPRMPLLARLLGDDLMQQCDSTEHEAPTQPDTTTTPTTNTECRISPSSFPSFTTWLSPETTTTTTTCSAVERAMRAWLQQSTHMEIKQVLQRECDELSTLAELRLNWLRFIRRRRALLECDVAVQARCGRLSLSDQVPIQLSTQHNTTNSNNAVEEKDETMKKAEESAVVKGSVRCASRPSSVGFTSAMSSATASTQLPPISNKNGNNKEEEAVQDTIVTHSVEEDEELRLLLDASLYLDAHDTRGTAYCLQPRSTVATIRQTLQSRRITTQVPTAAKSKKSDESANVPSAAQPQQTTSNVDKTNMIDEKPASEPVESEAVDVKTNDMPLLDTSEVDRYGTRQDLSLDRLVREATEVMEQLQACHATMLHEVDRELTCVHELHDRIVAMQREEQDKSTTEHEGEGHSSLVRHVTSDVEVAAKVRQMRAEYDAAIATATTTTISTVAVPTGSEAERDLRTPPAIVRRLAAMPSPAALLAYVRTARAQLQAALLQCHIQRVRHVHGALESAYKAYYDATGDAAYASFPACALWLRELRVEAATSHEDSDKQMDIDNVTSALAELSVEEAMASVESRLQAATEITARATQELTGLQQRLDILTQAGPLLEHRTQILREQQEMREGSRARLLSKKINMAKQLLHEEMVRRRIAKELPAITLQLQGLVQSWEQLEATRANMSTEQPPTSTCRALCVHGVDVKALLAEGGSASATPTNAARRRGVAGYAASLDRSKSQPTQDKLIPASHVPHASNNALPQQQHAKAAGVQRRPFQGKLHIPTQVPRAAQATCISPRPRKPVVHPPPSSQQPSMSRTTPPRVMHSSVPRSIVTAVARSASPPALTKTSSPHPRVVTPSVLAMRGATLKRLRSASQTRHFATTPSPPAQRTLRVMHF